MNFPIKTAGLVAVAFAAAVWGQTPAKERGRVVEHDRGRPAEKANVVDSEVTGLLVDGSCRDRTVRNLRQPPEPLPAKTARENTAEAKQQTDVLVQLVPDSVTRQDDRTCAITGGTQAFSVLLESGRLVNLDEGGNTRALQALQASAAGRAMLSGTGPGIKPRVTINGRLRGDQLIVKKIVRLQ
jgi:hypothetical protein